MKQYLVFILLFLFPFLLTAQKLTGIWHGYFYPDMDKEEAYNYEIQLNHVSNKSIKGVTYSWFKQKSFYGKADLEGIYLENTQTLTISETHMLEIRPRNAEAQIMTCYLTYSKIGNTEYLNGAYSSINAKDKSMGRSGKVFLERVEKTDFVREPFLLKKSTPSAVKPKSSSENAASNPKSPRTNPAPNVKITGPSKIDTALPVNTPASTEKQTVPIPSVIKERENKLVKRIETNSPDIKVELYDNGEIDGDTITVYHNYRLIADRKGLNYKPITIKVMASASDSLHEFIMVANNLGSIPPNTALMVITTGGKRYELFIGTDERKNAKVIVEYRKPD